MDTVSIWGLGKTKQLTPAEEFEVVAWNGALANGYFGFDTNFKTGFRSGAAVSYADSHVEFTNQRNQSVLEGQLKSNITSISPYLGYQSLDDDTTLWVSMGYGTGTVQVEQEGFKTEEAQTQVSLASFYGNQRLASVTNATGSQTSELHVSGEGWLAQQYTHDFFGGNNDLGVDIQSFSVATEATHHRLLTSGWLFNPHVALEGLIDAGDGETGTSVILRGGTAFTDINSTTVSAEGWSLLNGDYDHNHWGLQGSVQYDTQQDRLGFNAMVDLYANQPPIDSLFGTEDLWRQDQSQASFLATSSIATEIGYGFALFDSVGQITPFGDFGITAENQNYQLGVRIGLGNDLSFEMKGARKISFDGQQDFRYRTKGSFKW